MKPFYKSKKWWMAFIAAAIPVLNSSLGLDLDAQELATVVIPLIAYVFGEAWIDAKH